MKISDKIMGYDAKVSCYNCKHKGILRIKRGMTVNEFLRLNETVCKNCGCNTLQEVRS